jgi:hypothetical protein
MARIAYCVLRIWPFYALRNTQYASLLTAVFLTATLVQGWTHYPSYALSQQEDARRLCPNAADEAPPDSLILAHWHWVTPLRYLQTVEGQRPDVAVEFVFPRGEPYDRRGGGWRERAWENGRSVITTHYAEFIYEGLPPPQPIGEAFLFAQTPLTALPADCSPLDLRLGDQIHLQGYRLDQTEGVAVGQTAVLTLAWAVGRLGQNP